MLDFLDAIARRWFRFDTGGHGFIGRPRIAADQSENQQIYQGGCGSGRAIRSHAAILQTPQSIVRQIKHLQLLRTAGLAFNKIISLSSLPTTEALRFKTTSKCLIRKADDEIGT